MKPVPEDPRNAPLNPVERLAVEFELTGHQDEADALLLLDATFSHICAAHPDTLTECAQELQDKMIEALGFWLPADLVISDGSGIHPAKNPMEGGFSMEKFMAGISKEDAEALAAAFEESERHDAEFDSGIPEGDLMDRLKDALDQRDAYRAALSRMFDHAAEVRGYADGWEWKYGQAWDEEMNAARNLLDGCQAG